jgi:hypothetical protein
MKNEKVRKMKKKTAWILALAALGLAIPAVLILKKKK